MTLYNGDERPNAHLSDVMLSLAKQGKFLKLFADKAYLKRLHQEYNMLIDTSCLIEEEVKKITGLTSEELLAFENDGKFPRRVQTRIISFWKKKDVDRWVTETLNKPVEGDLIMIDLERLKKLYEEGKTFLIPSEVYNPNYYNVLDDKILWTYNVGLMIGDKAKYFYFPKEGEDKISMKDDIHKIRLEFLLKEIEYFQKRKLYVVDKK